MGERSVPSELDRAALDELLSMVDGDAAFLDEMIDTFLGDGPARLAELRLALASSDVTALRRAAHTLKSNSRTFGASTLAALCQELEARAAGGVLDDAPAVVARIEAEYGGVVLALRALGTSV